MPGLRGQLPESRNRDAVARRNSQNLARKVNFISASEVIALTPGGKLTITLASAGGLTDTDAELAVKLDGNELALSTDGLTISQAFQKKVEQAGNTMVPIALAAIAQVAAEEAAEEAIVASATLSWMGI